MTPDDLLFTKEHEWLRIVGETGTIGISDHAQKELGEVVYVELPKVGTKFDSNEPFGNVESVKAVSELFLPVSGESIEQFFSGVPEKLRFRRLLNIPKALTEPELVEYFQQRAARNSVDGTSFIGAGVYRHYIPIIIDALISRSEFYTAYTPYQAEIAQGTLQAIFEFQTYIAQLTGMDVANASLYDGSTGLAEAVLMGQRITRKHKFLVARTVHPEYRAVADTYVKNLGIQMELLDYTADGRLDLEQLERKIDSNTAAVVFQSPNFFGTIERTHDVAEMAHKHDA